MRGGGKEAGGGYGDAERYIRLVSERDLQPGYPLTGCDVNSELQSGSNMRCLWPLDAPTMLSLSCATGGAK